MKDLEKLQKQINLAQSFVNWVTNENGGDKELMEKLGGLHVEEINSIVLKLLKINKDKIQTEIEKSKNWIEFLETIKNL